jgi:hypothetical protein
MLYAYLKPGFKTLFYFNNILTEFLYKQHNYT